MYIITIKYYIKVISKKINPKSTNAESAQISYYTKKDTKLLFQEVDSLINKNLLNLFPASAYSRLIKNSKMIIKFVNPLHWFEIDNKKDLRKIRKKINTQKKLELFKEYVKMKNKIIKVSTKILEKEIIEKSKKHVSLRSSKIIAKLIIRSEKMNILTHGLLFCSFN